MELREIYLDQLEADPAWERSGTGSGNAPELSALAASLQQRGQLEPLRVFPIGERKYRISSGHRRAIAARLAKVPSVLCYVVDAPATATQQQFDRIVANSQRSDLTEIELARDVRAVLDADSKLTVAEISRQIGIAAGHLNYVLSLLTLPAQVQEMMNVPGAQGKTRARKFSELLNYIDGPEYGPNGLTGRTAADVQLDYARQIDAMDYNLGWIIRTLGVYATEQARFKARQETRVDLDANGYRTTPKLVAQQIHDTNRKLRIAPDKPSVSAAERESEKQHAAANHAEIVRQRNHVATRVLDGVLGFTQGQQPTLELLKVAALLALESSKIYTEKIRLIEHIHAVLTVDEVLEVIGFIARSALTLDDECRHVAGPELPRLYVEIALNANGHIERALHDAGLIVRREGRAA